MTASFKGLRSAKQRVIFVIGLCSLSAWYFPALVKASAQTPDQQKSLVFEIKSTIETQTVNGYASATVENSGQPNQNQPIEIQRIGLVRNYLDNKTSPLSNYTEILLHQKDWKTIIAISNSESNMGKHCYFNNCSGIFGENGLRTYKTIPDWIADMQSLISQHYNGMTLQQMDGIWVQPKSYNWLEASTTVYHDLQNIEQQVNAGAVAGAADTAKVAANPNADANSGAGKYQIQVASAEKYIHVLSEQNIAMAVMTKN